MVVDDDDAIRDAALADLKHHWGTAYEISEGSGVWRAVRKDNQRVLLAGDPGELRDLIREDYAADPVRR
jgi:hypothetical protein